MLLIPKNGLFKPFFGTFLFHWLQNGYMRAIFCSRQLILIPDKNSDKRHLRYIKQHHKIRYTNLLTSCKLTAYLADIDEQAEEMFFRLVNQLAEKEGVTEQLKAENQMLWVQRMNNIRDRAMEVVNSDLIYA